MSDVIGSADFAFTPVSRDSLPTIQGTGRKPIENPFTNAVRTLVESGEPGTTGGMSFTVPGPNTTGKDGNQVLNRVRAQLSAAGRDHGVSVRIAREQRGKVGSKTDLVHTVVTFWVVPSIKRPRAGK